LANYNAYSRTNYFRVKDELAKEVLKNLIAQIKDAELWEDEEDGTVAFGGYCSITEYYDNDKEDYVQTFKTIQSLLPDGEVCVLTEVGHEKLRYLVGISWMITNKKIVTHNLSQKVEKSWKKLATNGQTLNMEC
jgi:hypothetical protein